MATYRNYLNEQKKKHPKAFGKFDAEYEEFKLEVLGELIRKTRQEKGLTQTQLADLIHTKKQAISRLERSPQDVRLSTIFKVSKALGKSLIRVG